MAVNESSNQRQILVSWTALQVVIGIFCLVLGTCTTLLAVALLLFTIGDVDPALVAAISSLALGIIILVIVWNFALRSNNGSFVCLGIRSSCISGWVLACWTGGMFLVSVLFTGVYTICVRELGIEELLPPENYGDILLDDVWLTVSFAALALWTPFTEELFFRGFVYKGFSQRFGQLKAILISAGIFSAFHVLAGPGVLIPIFVSGIALAWLYHRTGSVWPSIVVHAIQNSLALIASIYTLDGQTLGAIILEEVFNRLLGFVT